MTLIDELKGESVDRFSIFKGSIRDEDDLHASAQSTKDIQLLYVVYFKRFMSSFWKGSYADAEKCSKIAFSFPASKMPKIHLIIHTFFQGLIAFQMFRDGAGEHFLFEGKSMLDRMESWLKNSAFVFENKALLLQAEHCASVYKIRDAIKTYDASIKSARDHGLIHEQGLANECKGKFLTSIDNISEDPSCFRKAYECYVQWGAVTKADQIRVNHKLELPN